MSEVLGLAPTLCWANQVEGLIALAVIAALFLAWIKFHSRFVSIEFPLRALSFCKRACLVLPVLVVGLYLTAYLAGLWGLSRAEDLLQAVVVIAAAFALGYLSASATLSVELYYILRRYYRLQRVVDDELVKAQVRHHVLKRLWLYRLLSSASNVPARTMLDKVCPLCQK